MMTREQLRRYYPAMLHPMYCENGCGAVIELGDAFESYRRTSDDLGQNRTLLICECCAAEDGHRHEADEGPEQSPVCRRKPKKRLR